MVYLLILFTGAVCRFSSAYNHWLSDWVLPYLILIRWLRGTNIQLGALELVRVGYKREIYVIFSDLFSYFYDLFCIFSFYFFIESLEQFFFVESFLYSSEWRWLISLSSFCWLVSRNSPARNASSTTKKESLKIWKSFYDYLFVVFLDCLVPE